MALASVGSLGSAQSSTNNQASASLVTTAALEVGNWAFLIVAVDNNATADGDEGAVSSVVDSTGVNVWTKAREFTNAQGAAQAGSTCSIWYCANVTAELASGGTITANFTNSASRDKSVMSAWEGTKVAGRTIAVEASNTLANDGADPGSLDATTANIECFRVRGIAGETNSATAIVNTLGWASVTGNQTTGGGAAANMALRGEFIVSTATGAASDPTWTLVTVDCASVYVAFKEVTTVVEADGAASGSATASADTGAIKAADGAASGAASSSVAVTAIAGGVWSSAGAGAASADSAMIFSGVGSSDGVAAASAVSGVIAGTDGSAAGASTAQAAGAADASGVGSSDGVGTASGVGASTAEAVGAAAGAAEALAAGNSTAGAVFSSDGIAVVDGLGGKILSGVGTCNIGLTVRPIIMMDD